MSDFSENTVHHDLLERSVFACPYCGSPKELICGRTAEMTPRRVFEYTPPEKRAYQRFWLPDRSPLLFSDVSYSIRKEVSDLLECGWRPASPEDMRRIFPDGAVSERRRGCEDFSEFNPLMRSGYGYALFFCPKCLCLHTRFDFTLTDGYEIYRPYYKCPDCRVRLVYLHGGISAAFRGLLVNKRKKRYVKFNLRCPKCGKMTILNYLEPYCEEE